jgi:hypothetical protein
MAFRSGYTAAFSDGMGWDGVYMTLLFLVFGWMGEHMRCLRIWVEEGVWDGGVDIIDEMR